MANDGAAILVELSRADRAALASAVKPMIALRNAPDAQYRAGLRAGFGDALAGLSVTAMDKLFEARAKDVLRTVVNSAPMGVAQMEQWLAKNTARRELILAEFENLLAQCRKNWPAVKAKATMAESPAAGGAA